MERQTLQQQTPVYHVCQACGGDGCAACSDLCILDGDIDLDLIADLDLDITPCDKCPNPCLPGQLCHYRNYQSPINGVIGINHQLPF